PPAPPPPQVATITPQPAAPMPPRDIPQAPQPEARADTNSNDQALADDPTIKSLTTKIDANPDDVSALYRRGQVYASKGAYNLAIKDFDGTLQIHPQDVVVLNNRC